MTKKHSLRESPTYTLTQDGRGSYDVAQPLGVSCPSGHWLKTYKTRIPSNEVQIRCPHCGKQCYVTQRVV